MAWRRGARDTLLPSPLSAIRASKTIRLSLPTCVNQPQNSPTCLTTPRWLLSESDPLGLVQTDHTGRSYGSAAESALLEAIPRVGGSANANAGHLGPLVADSFPCGTGACALNVGATVVPGRVGSRGWAAEFIGSSRYGVLWSADAVRSSIRYCWETFAFPRSIPQTEMEAVRLTIDGIEQTADAISVFQLETLDVIELEYGLERS